jgi:HK97 gp10 family phage protein
MATLNEISTSLKNLAQLNVQRPPTRAVKTGKLRDSINVKYRKIGDFGAVFDLNTVDYGVYVNFGTFKMDARPFATNAANADEFKALVDDYVKKTVVVTVLDSAMARIDSSMKRLSKGSNTF